MQAGGYARANTTMGRDEMTTLHVAGFLTALEKALAENDAQGAAALFGPECYWRDLAALTWNIHTAQGQPAIAAMLSATLATAQPHGFTPDNAGDSEEGWFNFQTATGRGRGHVKLVDGSALTLLTTLQSLNGFEEKQGATRPEGVEWGARRGRITWMDRRQKEIAELGHTVQPYVLIVGGGQGGIALAARLRRFTNPTTWQRSRRCANCDPNCPRSPASTRHSTAASLQSPSRSRCPAPSPHRACAVTDFTGCLTNTSPVRYRRHSAHARMAGSSSPILATAPACARCITVAASPPPWVSARWMDWSWARAAARLIRAYCST